MQLLRKIVFPISLVYALVVFLRNYFFDIGILKERSYPTKTICVGNLSVGGTGKTPMVEYLISTLAKNHKVAVLSRGYKRRSGGFILANSSHTVEDLGDEPFQIASKFPDITVAVDSDRRNGIEQLELKTQPDFIVLDDAFQHRRVKPELTILLTAYNDLYINDWYLPTGNLRDGIRQARRADLIIVTKCPDDLEFRESENIVVDLKIGKHQQVLFSCINYSDVIFGSDGSKDMGELIGESITLVTGIANAKHLVGHLKKKRINFDHLEYRDHHFFTDSEIALFSSKGMILTTEKDYVRLKSRLDNLYYLPIRQEFLFDGDKIMKKRIAEFTN